MEELEDKVLLCRQCGKEFTFTRGEQEFYIKKGWFQPNRCPQCRSARHEQDLRLVCSGCSIELGKDDPVYCSECVDNLKPETEPKPQGQQEKTKESEMKSASLDELEPRLETAIAKLEGKRQTKQELQCKIAILELENTKLNNKVASWNNIEALIQQLNEHFKAFQQSYACDVDKLAGLLLEIQSSVARKRHTSLLYRVRLALAGKACRHNKGGRAGDTNEPLAQNNLQTRFH